MLCRAVLPYTVHNFYLTLLLCALRLLLPTGGGGGACVAGVCVLLLKEKMRTNVQYATRCSSSSRGRQSSGRKRKRGSSGRYGITVTRHAHVPLYTRSQRSRAGRFTYGRGGTGRNGRKGGGGKVVHARTNLTTRGTVAWKRIEYTRK